MAKGIFTLRQVNQAIRQGAWSAFNPPQFVEYLVVAGGGSGGLESYQSGSGGGGGAGGLLTGIVPVTAGTSYTVTVGAGGASHTGLNPGGGSKGNNGNNSIFSSITATGGGAGSGGSGSGDAGVGSGGSGGGGKGILSGGSGILGQGNAGGISSGVGIYSTASGGGGAGTVGISGTGSLSQWGGDGGAGVASNISGIVTTYAGGGGGSDGGGILVSSPGRGGVGGGGRAGSYVANGITVVGGSPNTGGGGGGAANQYNFITGAGGSGIVIVRYPGNVQFYTGGAVTYANGHVVHTFYVTDTLAPTTPTAISTTGDYQISRSLRFNSADSAYLSRTLTTPTNNTVWSFSFWLKRSKLTTQQYLLNVNSYCGIGISNDIIYFWDNTGVNVASTAAVFRDASAWYHLIFVSNGTTIKGYVNNSEVMSYTGTITNLNSAIVHNIGRDQTSNSLYLDGYMTEINFIDGQALTPSSFGETNSNTGVWGPKAYSGSYGTNGFYLNFSDNSNTTAATLGKDYSGNGNNWTPNNFSVTAGVGNDSLLDTPTPYGTDTGLGGEVRGNYCTLNPLGIAGAVSSNGNLSINASSASGNRISTFLLTSGKWYWEGKGEGYVGAIVGIGGEGFTPTLSSNGSKSIGYWWADGLAYGDTFYSSAGAVTYTSSDTIGIALDMDMGNVRFYKNNTLIHNLTFGKAGTSGYVPNLSAGVYPGYNAATGTYNADFNFGQRPFTYTAPSGYKAICTTNLPTPAIGASPTSLASKFFNTVLWTGDGSQTRSITGVGFQPDFTWMKIRADTPQDHQLYDAVRGAGGGKNLSTNTTAAEGTVGGYLDSDYGYLSSFDSDGFSVNDGAVATTGGYVNYSARTYVAWNWKASNATAVTDTSGSLTSSVRANRTSGFSIVTYTGNSGADQTVGHGLGVVPSWIIAKQRTAAGTNWVIYHTSLGVGKVMIFTNSGEISVAGYWGAANTSSTVFGVKGGGYDNNTNGASMVAYCFAPIEGYSAFGSYTGNGSADGPFVFTGFRPALLLVKRTDTTADWVIFDSARNGYNIDNKILFPNLSSAESAGGNTFDILSNGFKARNTNGEFNGNNSPYIYMAFAQNPFKYSLAR